MRKSERLRLPLAHFCLAARKHELGRQHGSEQLQKGLNRVIENDAESARWKTQPARRNGNPQDKRALSLHTQRRQQRLPQKQPQQLLRENTSDEWLNKVLWRKNWPGRNMNVRMALHRR
jgi:hypothetical protein